jgi:hypothetical protein
MTNDPMTNDPMTNDPNDEMTPMTNAPNASNLLQHHFRDKCISADIQMNPIGSEHT